MAERKTKARGLKDKTLSRKTSLLRIMFFETNTNFFKGLEMTREQNRQKIYDFLMHKGADKFWANAALKHIMLNFAGNTFWLSDIRLPKVIVGSCGMIDKFTVNCSINTESQKVNGKLIYTHGSSHKVQVKQLA